MAWLRLNWPGLLIAGAVTAIAGCAVEPALRVLSDEANLLGTSKNLFASKTATFTVSGKYYYDSYWDIDVAIDRRPTLFPFLVSLIHAVRGYSPENVFLLNLLVLWALLLASYRLAKSAGGETCGMLACLLVAAHPITLISARSGGFDLLAVLFAVLALKSLHGYLHSRTPAELALTWLHLCLLAETRYETALFIPPILALLLLSKSVAWSTLRPYAVVYALTPVYLLPRLLQSILRGNVPEQEPGTVTFSARNFFANTREYFEPLLSPFEPAPAHSALVIALGLVGCWYWLKWLLRAAAARQLTPELRFALCAGCWILVQAVLVFTYVWGRAQYPSAARLVLALDTFFSFGAAWALTRLFARWRPFVAGLLGAALLLLALPVASQHRTLNRLTQTRESAATWRFFEELGEKRILIVTDRPNHFTILNYGAMSFESARRDPYLFTALDRRLFQDVYVIQQIRLSTNEVLPRYAMWADRELEPVFEFQNDADVLVRISRVVRLKTRTG